MLKHHTTKNGDKVLIRDLETYHLENIIKFIEKKAKEGWVVQRGGGTMPEDIWYDEDLLFGEEVKEYMNYNAYNAELRSRQQKAGGEDWPASVMSKPVEEMVEEDFNY